MSESAKQALNWALDRLSEQSTWRGIVLALTSAGIVISPDNSAKIIAAGLAIVGVINIFRKETKPQVNQTNEETKTNK